MVTSADFVTVMISCRSRDTVRMQTLSSLASTDWPSSPLVFLDDPTYKTPEERQQRNAAVALQSAVTLNRPFILFLEDDLEFNQHLWHNLATWRPLKYLTLASLYNPNIQALRQKPLAHFFEADPDCIYGSQAYILSHACAGDVLRRWHDVDGMQDIKMSRLAASLGMPIYYYVPSLVQHVGYQSTFGGTYHQATDFDRRFKLSDENVSLCDAATIATISDVYDQSFFEMQSPWRAEYDCIADTLVKMLAFSSALDLGCGSGFLIARLNQLGKHVRGVDGSVWARAAAPREITAAIDIADLTVPLREERYDLVLCMEVAEELEPRFADVLVTSVCMQSSRLVVFSAATPGQGGYCHVNEQPHEYWISKFGVRGFEIDRQLTERFRIELAERIHTTWWFARNAMVFRATSETSDKNRPCDDMK